MSRSISGLVNIAADEIRASGRIYMNGITDENGAIIGGLIEANGGLSISEGKTLQTDRIESKTASNLIIAPASGKFVHFANMPPYVMATLTNQQSITTSLQTTILFNNAVSDRFNMYSAGSFTIPFSGIYLCICTCNFSPAVGGNRNLDIIVNGATISGITYPTQIGVSVGTRLCLYNTLPLTIGDVVQFKVFHSSGSNITVGAATTKETHATITYLSGIN